MKRKQRNLENLSDILPEIMGRYLSKSGGFQMMKLRKSWKDIVGSVLARESYICGLKNHILLVGVTNSSWMQEIFMMKKEILQRIRENSDFSDIEDIHFRMGIPQKDKQSDSSEGLFIEKNKNPDFSKIQLSDSEKRKIISWADSHASSFLKEQIAQLIMDTVRKRKAEIQNGWHPCRSCGSLCPKEEKVCFLCRMKEKRNTVYSVMVILKKKPHLLWEQVNEQISCTYGEYAEGKENLVHRYRQNLFRGQCTADEKKQLLSLLIHKKTEEITEEETEALRSFFPRK
jgi:hypothetical protein